VQAQADTADLVLTKSHTPLVVDAGSVVTYTLLVFNTGPASASSVQLTDTLPLRLTLLGASPPPGSQNGRVLTWSLGDLADEELQTVELVVQVDGDASGSLINQAQVSSSTEDPDLSDNAETDIAPLTHRSDLSVSKADTPDPVVASRLLTYTLYITNAGPSDAAQIVVSDTVPSETTVVSVDPLTQTQAGQSLTWSFPSFSSQQVRMITVVVSVDQDAVGAITNTVAVRSDSSDPDLSNNQALASTVVVEDADLEISKADDPDPVAAGGSVAYTLVITNHGPLDADGVWVTDTLPSGLSVVQTQPSVDSVVGSDLGWNLGTLGSGAVTTILIVVDVDPGQTGVLTNSAIVSAMTPDSVPSNNGAVIDTQVISRSNMTISKVDDPDPVYGSQILTYTLLVVNEGPSDATGVVVTDSLPASVALSSVQPPTQAQSAGELTWSLGMVASGASVPVTVVVAVDTEFVGPLTNAAGVSSDVEDPDESDNVAVEGTTVLPAVGLAVDKQATYGWPLSPGERITYTVVVSNVGAADATGVRVTDGLSPEVTYVVGSITLEPVGAGTEGTAPPELASGVTVGAGERVTVS